MTATEQGRHDTFIQASKQASKADHSRGSLYNTNAVIDFNPVNSSVCSFDASILSSTDRTVSYRAMLYHIGPYPGS